MDPGNNSGNLDITDPIRSLIPGGLIRAQALTVGIYRSDPDGLICFHISWPLRGVSLICQSVVFQTADQIVKPLAIAQETGEI